MKIIEQFLKQLRKGNEIDESLFTEVYNQIYRWFANYIYSKSNEYYNEIINEAITRFLEKMGEFKGNTTGEFYLYIKSIIRTLLYSEKAKKSSSDVEFNSSYYDKRSNRTLDFEINEELDALYSCIDKLPEKLKKMVVGILLEKKKKDISKEINIHPSQFIKLFNTALNNLRDCLIKGGFSQEIVFN